VPGSLGLDWGWEPPGLVELLAENGATFVVGGQCSMNRDGKLRRDSFLRGVEKQKKKKKTGGRAYNTLFAPSSGLGRGPNLHRWNKISSGGNCAGDLGKPRGSG